MREKNKRVYANRKLKNQIKTKVQTNEKTKRNSEYQRRWRNKQKQEMTSTPIPEYKNRMTKCRSLKKFREALPNTPVKRVQVIAHYLNTMSPTVKKLESVNAITSKEDKQKVRMSESVLEDIKEALDRTKKRRSDENVQSRNILFSAMTGEKTTNAKFKRKLATFMKTNHRNITKGSAHRIKIIKDENSSWLFAKKKTRASNISKIEKRKAYDFWLSRGISRPTGDKKNIKRERIAPNVYISHAVHILEVTQTEAYMKFKEQNPEIKMSQRSFERLKPFFVRAVKNSDRSTCMCRYHVEVNTVFKACMKRRRALLEQMDSHIDLYPVYHSVNEMLNDTLCNKDDNTEDCINRICKDCGVRKLKFMPGEISTDNVSWECFEYVSTEQKTGPKKKLMLVKKQTASKEMFQHLATLLHNFSGHQFRAKWQNEQLRQNVTCLPMNDVVCVHDFSENYR